MPTNPRQKFQDLLTGFSHGMLVTKTSTVALHARPMALAEIAANGDLWFATGRDSRKVDEITADEHVCVTFQDGSHYVTVTGSAQTVRDRSKIEQLWSDAWRIWYPQGRDDPNLVLLRVTADTGEYWDNSGVKSLRYLFKGAKAYLLGERMETDEAHAHAMAEAHQAQVHHRRSLQPRDDEQDFCDPDNQLRQRPVRERVARREVPDRRQVVQIPRAYPRRDQGHIVRGQVVQRRSALAECATSLIPDCNVHVFG